MSALYLIARIGGQRFAMRAEAVESVAITGPVRPVPLAPPHVAGLVAVRSRVLTAIDGRAVVEPPCPGEGGRGVGSDCRHAIIVSVDGHGYAILVDGVEDAVEAAGLPSPLSSPLVEGWQAIVDGVVELADMPVPLVDPARLIAGRSIFIA